MVLDKGWFGDRFVLAANDPIVIRPMSKSQYILFLSPQVELRVNAIGNVELWQPLIQKTFLLVGNQTSYILAIGEMDYGRVVVQESHHFIVFDFMV
jgi:hypothetical protein